MPLHGVFIDPSEYRRNNFDFAGDRLSALLELGERDWIRLLHTDVSISETQRLIRRSVEEACDALRKSALSPLKSIADERMNLFKTPPTASELSEMLLQQFSNYMDAGSFISLRASEVDLDVIFEMYFENQPPFDSRRKKLEFPDAFTLQRLVMWAQENDTTVFVVGPDDDLRRTCEVREHLLYFEKIEALLHYINSADTLVKMLAEKRDVVIGPLVDFVREEFPNIMFMLYFNPHGDIENVATSEIDITDIYALEVGEEGVRAEAGVTVSFTANFSYEDLDTGFYDKETDEYYMTEYVHGELGETCDVTVRFDFSVDADGTPVVSDLSFVEDTITVREEDRGDYDAWK